MIILACLLIFFIFFSYLTFCFTLLCTFLVPFLSPIFHSSLLPSSHLRYIRAIFSDIYTDQVGWRGKNFEFKNNWRLQEYENCRRFSILGPPSRKSDALKAGLFVQVCFIIVKNKVFGCQKDPFGSAWKGSYRWTFFLYWKGKSIINLLHSRRAAQVQCKV